VLSSVTVLGLVAHEDIGIAVLQTQQTVYPVAQHTHPRRLATSETLL